MSERDWIHRYFAPLARAPGAAGLLDDTAELAPAARPVLITTDAMVEGVHFQAEDPVASLARKLVRVNVSDILSGGALPREALLTLGWPGSRPEAQLADFAQAFGDELGAWGISLLGGDTVASPAGLFLSLTLTGVCEGTSPIRRAGASPGDDLWVTGTIGAARLGFRARAAGTASPYIASLLEPVLPGAAAASVVARHASAAMDVSDGLLGDALALAAASSCGAGITLDEVPFAAPPAGLAEALDLSTWGDDYQLLLAAPVSVRGRLESDAISAGLGLTRIGHLRPQPGLSVSYLGRAVNLPETLGFEHGRIGVEATRP